METTNSKPLNGLQLPSPDANKKSGNTLISGYRYSIHATSNGFQLTANEVSDVKIKLKRSENILVALLPPNVQSEFKTLLLNRFPDFANNIHVGGASYAESITTHYFENLDSADQLPDILITSGFNIAYKKDFVRKFLTNKNFEPLEHSLHPMFREAGMAHPKNIVGLIAAEPLVILADLTYFDHMSVPREWYELLHPKLTGSIVFPNSEDYYRDAIYYPFMHNYGFKAIQQLKLNTKAMMHPSDMFTTIGLGTQLAAAVYIMPYFYALAAIKKNQDMRLVWPSDGAVAIPIQMFVKKGACSKNAGLIDFILSDKMGNAFVQNSIVSANENTHQNFHGNSLLWPGWNFLTKSSSNKLKSKILSITH
jgi:ABC-type Fe3+ transport system substrate-binding protein